MPVRRDCRGLRDAEGCFEPAADSRRSRVNVPHFDGTRASCGPPAATPCSSTEASCSWTAWIIWAPGRGEPAGREAPATARAWQAQPREARYGRGPPGATFLGHAGHGFAFG